MLLMIDNYDSFTYNIVLYLRELGADVHVIKNDEYSLQEIDKLNPEKIILSPGPSSPDNAGVSLSTIGKFGETLPILGVCLGHQCIAQHFGAKIVRARHVVHGKTSEIFHSGEGVFSQLKNPITATRYHSLVIDKKALPQELEITAWTLTEDGDLDEIMGIRHRGLALEGVQFHPESILSECGHDILSNFLSC